MSPLEHKLALKQTQKLVLSPQIKQYLKLLQQPILELQNSIDQELVENPALEEEAPESSDNLQENISSEDNIPETEELDFKETFDSLSKLENEFKESIYSGDTSRLEDIESLEKKHNYQESLIQKVSDLNEYLNWQLKFVNFNDEELKIAEEIIGNIDNDGYLKISIEELAEKFNVKLDTVIKVLEIIHSFDPPGVGARDLQECLLIQLLNKEDTDKEIKDIAIEIVKDNFDLLKRKEFTKISKLLNVPFESVERAYSLIKSLDPKPGKAFLPGESNVITPDASVYPATYPDEGYVIEIHDEKIPKLRLNKKYIQMLKDPNMDRKTKEYIKEKINSAMWFMKALDQRKSTLRAITEELVKEQSEFFERGFAFLKPLRLKDIAEKIGVHESTVSRAISGKYINTPQGTIPYKKFFSTKMETDDGSFESQKSIMEKIKFLIENEPPEKPYSDSKLVTLLRARGIKIARRTVAKYREMLKILPSHMRKKGK